MQISVSGKGTYHARRILKEQGLRWDAAKRAWRGDVQRLTVSLIRESMKGKSGFKKIVVKFDDPIEEEEYYGWPRWVCTCGNVIRKEDCESMGGDVFRCPFCQANTRLLEE